MIQPTYEIYTKGEDGKRAGLVQEWTTVQLVLRWNDESKWELSGSGRKSCPLTKGSGIIVYRNEEAILSGIADQLEESFSADTELYSWTASGTDDLGALAHRLVYPDPASETPSANPYTVTARLERALLDIIKKNAVEGTALTDRIIRNLSTCEPQGLGEEQTLSSSYDDVQSFSLNALSGSGLGFREVWNPSTGVAEFQIVQPADVSRTVVFSAENGTLSAWQRKQYAPEANYIIVRGMALTEATETDPATYQWAVVSDTESIENWGRIEKYVERGDISTVTDEETGEAETEEEVLARLQKAAAEELLEAQGTEAWSLTVTPTDMTEWRKTWNVGDTVSFVADGERFTSQIEEVKVTYSDAVETVTPSIGAIERGELSSIFDELGKLKKRIKVQEKL